MVVVMTCGWDCNYLKSMELGDNVTTLQEKEQEEAERREKHFC